MLPPQQRYKAQPVGGELEAGYGIGNRVLPDRYTKRRARQIERKVDHRAAKNRAGISDKPLLSRWTPPWVGEDLGRAERDRLQQGMEKEWHSYAHWSANLWTFGLTHVAAGAFSMMDFVNFYLELNKIAVTYNVNMAYRVADVLIAQWAGRGDAVGTGRAALTLLASAVRLAILRGALC